MSMQYDWAAEMPAAVTVAGPDGTILYMNARARETFAAGGAGLVGESVFDCHPEPARSRIRALYDNRKPNHYTISKRGVRKIIHQLPLFENGVFAGFVEISVPIPDELPHRERI